MADADALAVAPTLLGATITANGVTVRITEVEAYLGEVDAASHAWRGPTPRTASMFGPPRHLYVYRSHGIHLCANVVCSPAGEASAVLLRAGEVVDGIDAARVRRDGSSDRDLARGPARLCRALGIDLSANGAAPTLVAGESPVDISTGPRVGLRHAADRPWRLWITGDPTVSVYRPAAPRRRAGR